jgi:hypothetical protein
VLLYQPDPVAAIRHAAVALYLIADLTHIRQFTTLKSQTGPPQIGVKSRTVYAVHRPQCWPGHLF